MEMMKTVRLHTFGELEVSEYCLRGHIINISAIAGFSRTPDKAAQLLIQNGHSSRKYPKFASAVADHC